LERIALRIGREREADGEHEFAVTECLVKGRKGGGGVDNSEKKKGLGLAGAGGTTKGNNERVADSHHLEGGHINLGIVQSLESYDRETKLTVGAMASTGFCIQA